MIVKPLRPKFSHRTWLEDPNLAGKHFEGPSYIGLKALSLAIMGEKLNKAERAIYTEVTGRAHEPAIRQDETWVIAGRRAGKSLLASSLACYAAVAYDHKSRMAPAERACIPILSATQQQSSKVFQYCKGMFENIPLLRPLVANITRGTIKLTNFVDIEIRTANFKTIRSINSPFAIMDECASYSLEGSSNPDKEIYDALTPSLASLHGQLVAISSPFARRGILWDAYRLYYGEGIDDKILVAQTATRTLNPTIDPKIVERAIAKDACSARSEWQGQFRDDLEAFVAREIIESSIVKDRIELPPMYYSEHVGFVDVSGGGSDDFVLSIAHVEGDMIIVDALRALPPGMPPEEACKEHAATALKYNLCQVTGDKYAGHVFEQMFAKYGVNYVFAEKSKSELYSSALPYLNSRRVELLDHPKCTEQWCALERRVPRGSNRETIDHPAGLNQHDDCSNACAGAIVLASEKFNSIEVWKKLGQKSIGELNLMMGFDQLGRRIR